MSDTNAGASAEALTLFEQNIRRCSDKAYNFAFRLAGNEQDARDLVQEAFSHALQHLDRYDSRRPFEPWVNRILKNIYLDGVRRRRDGSSDLYRSSLPLQEPVYD